jgi:Zn-finger nucleic acid-binding protein
MPAALNCPNCGAAVPNTDTTHCDFCHSALTSIACPSCFAGIFKGMQFCPHCGAQASRAEQDDAAMECPACKWSMRRVQVGAISLMECPECASTWVDADTFAQLCIDREQRGAVVAMVGSRKEVVTPPADTAVRYRRCPVCRDMMNRQNFARRSGVILDVCKGHGVWMQRDELQAVLSFVDGGGLERARVLEAERQKEEQRKLLRELQELKSTREPRMDSSADFSISLDVFFD